MSVTPKQVLGLILVALAVVFAVENTRKTKIRFIVPHFTTPLWLALLVPLLLGFAAGALFVHRRR
jgi:putative membrane protein